MSCVPVIKGDETCANCGRLGSIIKLKNCNACRLVKYCGVDCQRAHRKQHKKACKQRAAELKDERLYSQGLERSEGDFCPLCTLPIPMPVGKHSVFEVCCFKKICNGCVTAAEKRGMLDCAFCRTPCADDDSDALAMVQARVEKKDPEAINFLGKKYYRGQLGLQKDMRRAAKCFEDAVELGCTDALHNLASAYRNGDGVEQNEAKGIHLYEKAAMQGHVESRVFLGCFEGHKGNFDRAVRHFVISAKMGHSYSLENIKEMFIDRLQQKSSTQRP